MSDSFVTNSVVIRAKLLVWEEDVGGYITYIFENLDSDCWDNKYVMCVRYPNWESNYPEVNDIGFLQCTYIIAGESYYNRLTDKEDVYQFTHIRFDKFLSLKDKKDNTIIL